MASLEKDHSYSGSSQEPVATAEEYAVPEVVITRRLRDRELLRKRKAEAEEKETHQEHKMSKPAKRGRGTRRGRGQRQALEAQAEPAEEKQEAPVTKLEEEPTVTLDFQAEPPMPLLGMDELYMQQQEPEAAPAEGVVSPVEEAPSSEEPEIPLSLENDHVDQDFYGCT
ncbi:hemogen isoform X2 [Varanus komodoensis]|uniref:hemogen isoform X2 n=1 Tax=Varanus komodoensis TaxID=61221 RepID=UPI001CF7947A|nr:hemogen isoform X2 [Varanus komodoensis]